MSDLASILGDEFKEGMTVEELKAAIEKKDLVDSTTLPKSVSKDIFDKTASELAQIKKERDTLKQQGLTEVEKATLEAEQFKTLLKAREQQLNKLSVEKIFTSNGITEADYKDMLDDVVTDDLDKSVNLATKMMNMLKKQQATIEAKVKADMMKSTPRTSDASGTANGEDIDKLIQEASASGNMAMVSALIRKKAEVTRTPKL